MRDDSIERFKEAAKPYGLDFIHIHDGNGDGMSTVMVRGEDAAIINRLIRRNNLDVLTDVTQDEIALDPARAAEVNEPIPEVIVDKDGVRVQDAVRDSRSSAQDMAVSYTHLDVYKRQVYEFASTSVKSAATAAAKQAYSRMQDQNERVSYARFKTKEV